MPLQNTAQPIEAPQHHSNAPSGPQTPVEAPTAPDMDLTTPGPKPPAPQAPDAPPEAKLATPTPRAKAPTDPAQPIADPQAPLRAATQAYLRLVVATNPEVPPELIQGESIEEIEHSLSRARELVRHIKEGLARSEHIPAGAPERGAPDIDALSPIEKIKYGLFQGGK